MLIVLFIILNKLSNIVNICNTKFYSILYIFIFLN